MMVQSMDVLMMTHWKHHCIFHVSVDHVISMTSLIMRSSIVHISERGDTLRVKTICMTAKQGEYLHYNVHSLYGHSEAIATTR